MRGLATLRHAARHGLCAACLLFAAGARAASLSPEALQILGKSLSFMQPVLTGEGTVAVVFDPRASGSRADGEAIAAAISGGLVAGGAVLHPKLVESGALAASDPRLLIVAAGASSEAVTSFARRNHVLSVTGDAATVTAGQCIMAIQSAGRVEILLNHEAAQGAGIGFATAFRMMVKEL